MPAHTSPQRAADTPPQRAVNWFRTQAQMTERFGAAIRQSFDEVFDGQRTGRQRESGRVKRPIPSSDAVSKRMSRQSTRDTAPEIAIRRQLHADGFRFRVDRAPLQGLRRKADIVFTRGHVAVFIDGCFWHRCPEHGTMPASNAKWWEAKLARNVERDAETNQILTEAGWTVVRIWEHEDPNKAARRVESALRSRSVQPQRLQPRSPAEADSQAEERIAPAVAPPHENHSS